uniref:tubulin polyglutamylase TTLL11 isoform X3 n=1 Tax=Pristiophorus japonicus TaxID=55135 RepID=UPI00398F53AB
MEHFPFSAHRIRMKDSQVRSHPTEYSAEHAREEIIEAEAQGMADPLSGTEQNWSPLCLKQVYPKYTRQFSYLLIVERIALLFIRFLGIKGTMKLGPTGFRTFIRTCKLSSTNLSMASVDILYIDIARRWNIIRGERGESGMCLQAFMEAIFHLAQRRYKSPPLREQVEALVNFCEYQLEALDEKHFLYGRATTDQRSGFAMHQPERPRSVTACSPAASFNPKRRANLGCRFCRNSHQCCSVIGLNDVRPQRVKLTQILHPSVMWYFM